MNNHYLNIEPFLQGELTGQHLLDFENALKSDDALAKAVTNHREMMERLDAYRIRTAVKSAISNERKPWWQTKIAQRMGIFAVLLFTGMTVTWFGYPRENQQPSMPPAATQPKPSIPPNIAPVAPAAPSPSPPVTVKKTNPSALIALAREFYRAPTQTHIRNFKQIETPADSRTQQAAQAFEANDFVRAAELLQSDESVLDHENARFIRANARFQVSQFKGASQDFLALSGSFQYQYEAQWGYLLAQVALGNTVQSRRRLEEMAADTSFPFQVKAQELLSKLPQH